MLAAGGARLSRLGPAAFALAAIAAAVLILALGHDFSFWYDEWWFITQRIPWTAHSFLVPHNDHLSVVPVLVYKLVLSTVGLDHYVVLRVVGLSIHLTCIALVFAYTRRRVGDVLALALSMPLLVLGAGGQDVLWPFQIGFVGSIAACIGALMAFDRTDRGARWLGPVLLVVSLMCSAVGVAFVVAAGFDRVLRSPRAALVEIGPVVILYAAWYAEWGTSAAHLSDADQVPRWIGAGARSGVDAMLRIGGVPSAVLAALLGTVVVILLARHRDARLAGLAAGALALWATLALGRAHLGVDYAPDIPRYVYVSAIFVTLVGAESARGVRPPAAVAGLAVALAAFSVVLNVRSLAHAADTLRGTMVGSRIVVTALGLSDPAHAHWTPRVGYPPGFPQGYKRALNAYGGSDQLSREQIARTKQAGYSLDALLVELDPPLTAVARAAAPRCAQRPSPHPPRFAGAIPATGLLVWTRGGSLSVRVRRYDRSFQDAPGLDLQGKATVVLRSQPPTRVPRWQFEAHADGPLVACPAS